MVLDLLEIAELEPSCHNPTSWSSDFLDQVHSTLNVIPLKNRFFQQVKQLLIEFVTSWLQSIIIDTISKSYYARHSFLYRPTVCNHKIMKLLIHLLTVVIAQDPLHKISPLHFPLTSIVMYCCNFWIRLLRNDDLQLDTNHIPDADNLLFCIISLTDLRAAIIQ